MSSDWVWDPVDWGRKRGFIVRRNPDGSWSFTPDPDWVPPPPDPSKPPPKPLPDQPSGPWGSAAGEGGGFGSGQGSGDGGGPGAGGSMSGPGGNFGGAGEGGEQPHRRDPLILDLDGDGIETINLRSGAFFDHDGDGFAEQTGWVAPDDGVLALDRNGDGIISDGRELFGDQTILTNGTRAANGFEALAELDTNRDGKMYANTPARPWLRVEAEAEDPAGPWMHR